MTAANTARRMPRRLVRAAVAGLPASGREISTMPPMVSTIPAIWTIPGRSPTARPHATGTIAAPAKIGATTLISASSIARYSARALSVMAIPATMGAMSCTDVGAAGATAARMTSPVANATTWLTSATAQTVERRDS